MTYDNTSFENRLFSKQLEGDVSGSKAQPYELDSLAHVKVNRFNADLVSGKASEMYQVGVTASGGQRPAPLLGATLRSLDHADKVISKRPPGFGGLFGAGESSGADNFGMTLQIPSLPPID